MQKESVVGVDIGGTKIAAGRVIHGQVIESCTQPTEADKDRNEILENLFSAIDKVLTPDIEAIGLGIPGIIDQSTGIIYEPANISAWKDLNLRDVVKEKYNLPVFIDNDANCFAIGSAVYGVCRGFKNVVGITLGTGLGAGIVIDSKLLNGFKNGAGEFGQIPYLDSNFETYCSGQFFESIKGVQGELIFKQAKAGDIKALTVWSELGFHLGKMIATILYSVAPEIIVFGGSVSSGYEYFMPELRKEILSFFLRTVADKVGFAHENNKDIALLGAAALVVT